MLLSLKTPPSGSPRLGPSARSRVLKVVYAGNIGAGQGLHHVLPKLAERLQGQAHFIVVGDGAGRDALVEAVASAGVRNVEILPPVERLALVSLYQNADVLFLHLNNFRAFERVLPSKLFEYAATGKPIWAGLAGYPANFANKKISNAAIFNPCDVEAAVVAFRMLKLTAISRDKFARIYSRKAIMKLMARSVLNTLASR